MIEKTGRQGEWMVIYDVMDDQGHIIDVKKTYLSLDGDSVTVCDVINAFNKRFNYPCVSFEAVIPDFGR